MQDASSRYARRAWGDALEEPVGPDRVITEICEQGGGQVARVLFPQRFGYNRDAPGISDIIDVDEMWQMPRDTFYTGGPGSYSGSSTPALTNSLGNA